LIEADRLRLLSSATTTGALIELQEWLSSHAVTHVAMEATGMYWKPVCRENQCESDNSLSA
jgi:hypothetical protein